MVMFSCILWRVQLGIGFVKVIFVPYQHEKSPSKRRYVWNFYHQSGTNLCSNWFFGHDKLPYDVLAMKCFAFLGMVHFPTEVFGKLPPVLYARVGGAGFSKRGIVIQNLGRENHIFLISPSCRSGFRFTLEKGQQSPSDSSRSYRTC